MYTLVESSPRPPPHRGEVIALDHWPCLMTIADYNHHFTQNRLVGVLWWITISECTLCRNDVCGLLPGITTSICNPPNSGTCVGIVLGVRAGPHSHVYARIEGVTFRRALEYTHA